MVKNLQHLPKPNAPKRLEGGRFNHQRPLDTFVTQHTAELFDVLVKDGQKRATSFLLKELPDWSTDLTYLEMQEKACQMKVVNDCAERGIALVEEYNSSLTKDEVQKQFLFRLVDLHRKQFRSLQKLRLWSWPLISDCLVWQFAGKEINSVIVY